jgi:hypothetical protein
LAGCETYQENKDICKFPGDREKIGFVEKLIPEKGESLGEGPIDREDLMRPTSSSTKSRENERERARISSYRKQQQLHHPLVVRKFGHHTVLQMPPLSRTEANAPWEA